MLNNEKDNILSIIKENHEINIEEERIHFNEPTYEFEIGDRVIYGALKESIVDYISDDKKVYGLRCIATDNNYGNPYDYQTYRICGWHEIRPITHGITNFGSNQDVRINFVNSTIESLIHKYYAFGINMNPMIAGLSMTLSSVTVILNTFRLKKIKVRKC